jgi:hypothetical protein
LAYARSARPIVQWFPWGYRERGALEASIYD